MPWREAWFIVTMVDFHFDAYNFTEFFIFYNYDKLPCTNRIKCKCRESRKTWPVCACDTCMHVCGNVCGRAIEAANKWLRWRDTMWKHIQILMASKCWTFWMLLFFRFFVRRFIHEYVIISVNHIIACSDKNDDDCEMQMQNVWEWFITFKLRICCNLVNVSSL